MAIPDLRLKTGSISLEVCWTRISLFEQKVAGPSPAITPSQADSHACTDTHGFQGGYKQTQVLPGQPSDQQQGEHSGHCNLNIVSKYLNYEPEKEKRLSTAQHTLHLYFKKKSKLQIQVFSLFK